MILFLSDGLRHGHGTSDGITFRFNSISMKKGTLI
jgi:hypothetical protein